MFERSAKLEKVFRRHPGAPVFARLAEQALRRDRLMRAQVLCEEGCERFPDYPTGHVVLGRVYETQGLWEEARAAFDQGLRLDPDQPAVYRRLSRVYCELGNTTLAFKCLESAARLDPLSESVSRRLEELATVARLQTKADAEQERTDTEQATKSPPAPVVESEPAIGPASEAPGPQTESSVSVPAESALPAASPFASGAADPPAQEISEDPMEVFAQMGPEAAADVAQEDVEEATEIQVAAEPFSVVQPMPEWDESLEGPTASAPSSQISGQETAPVQGTDAGPDPDSVAGSGPGSEPVPDSDVDDGLTPHVVGEDATHQTRIPAEHCDVSDSQASAHEFDSEVAALGEGLFEESDLEPEETVAPPVQRARPAPAPTPEAAPPAEPVEPQVVPSAEDTVPVAQAAAEPVIEQHEKTPKPVSAAEVPPEADIPDSDAPAVAGFALRADDSLRGLVADIEAQKGEDETGVDEEPLPIPTITLAELYNQQGFGDRAAKIYQQILAIDPTNASALAGLENVSTAE